MTAAAPSGDGMRSLHAAAGLCLASPLAACVVQADGRVHVFNEPYRALVSAHDGLTSFASPWGQAIPAALAAALAGISTLVETPIASETVTLSLIPVRDDGTTLVCGVFVFVIRGTAGVAQQSTAQQFDAFRYTLAHDLLSPLRTLQEMARILEREHSQQLPPDASVFLSHFSEGTHKLAARVEALIGLVKLDSQPLNCHRVDVSRLV